MNPKIGRVLLVVNNPAEALLLQRALAEPGGIRFDVELAKGIAMACVRLTEYRFDAVVLDLSPSGNLSLDGFETLLTAACGAPIVVLTGPNQEDLALRALQAGARDCLFKRNAPHQELLVRALRHTLDGLQQGRELASQVVLLGKRDAELAEYRSHGNGPGEVFSREPRRFQNDLPQALADGSLLLDYQPIVRLADGEVVGFEAFVRWPHPVRGMVRLTELNLIAEEMGLSLRLTTWVIAESCRRFGEWLSLHSPCAPELALHVNLPRSCLADPLVVGRLQETLAAHGIPAARLVIEISESLCADRSSTSRLVCEIRAVGVRVAFDDFGIGSRYLGYLDKLPVNMIKMDPTLVDRLGSSGNLEKLDTLFDQAGRLGIAVVAEGVSTEPQLALLCGLGCDLAQGALFAGPCGDQEIRALVGGEHPWDNLIAESGSSQDWCLAVVPGKGNSEGDGSLDDWLLAACRSLW